MKNKLSDQLIENLNKIDEEFENVDFPDNFEDLPLADSQRLIKGYILSPKIILSEDDKKTYLSTLSKISSK